MKFTPIQKLKVSLTALLFAIILLPSFSFASSSGLVIDEFRIDGLKGDKDEYVIVTNYGLVDILLDQYALTIKTSNTTYQYLYRFLAGSSIKSKQKIKICHNSVVGDVSCELFYTATSYEMKQNGVLAIINTANNKENIDVIGYGEIDYGSGGCWITGCEKYPLESPAIDTPYKRIDGQDTDASSLDFQAITTPIPIDVNSDKVVISELLPNPETGEEWFELFNPTNLDVSLSNLKICDVLGARHCYFFDKTDVLFAESYKTYAQSVTKITLNNNGDWLELYDIYDNLLADSGGDYGSADKGISLSLFGNEYRWTKSLTPGGQNIFVDTIEIEEETVSKPKTTKPRVVTVAKKTIVPAGSTSTDEAETPTSGEPAVKASETTKNQVLATKPTFGKKTLGWALIGMAILLVVSYICWYFRDYAKNIYNKIRHRDDSARF
jgi:hypothetical protein